MAKAELAYWEKDIGRQAAAGCGLANLAMSPPDSMLTKTPDRMLRKLKASNFRRLDRIV